MHGTLRQGKVESDRMFSDEGHERKEKKESFKGFGRERKKRKKKVI